MSTRFAALVAECEEEQVIEACQTLRLRDDDTAYILATHRRSSYLLDLVLVLGGGLGDYIRMRLGTRRALLDSATANRPDFTRGFMDRYGD